MQSLSANEWVPMILKPSFVCLPPSPQPLHADTLFPPLLCKPVGSRSFSYICVDLGCDANLSSEVHRHLTCHQLPHDKTPFNSKTNLMYPTRLEQSAETNIASLLPTFFLQLFYHYLLGPSILVQMRDTDNLLTMLPLEKGLYFLFASTLCYTCSSCPFSKFNNCKFCSM